MNRPTINRPAVNHRIAKRFFKKRFSKLLVAAFTITALSYFALPASSAWADEYSRIKSYATSVRSQTRSLLNKTHDHYVNTPYYAQLVAGTSTLRQQAESVRLEAKHGCDVGHLAGNVNGMSVAFADLCRLYDETEALASQGQGFVVGNTKSVGRQLDSIDDRICSMQDQLESLYAHAAPVVVRRPVLTQVPAYTVVQRPVVIQRPVVVQRPVVEVPVVAGWSGPGGDCPYGRRGSYGSGPIVTKVETFQIPASDWRR